VKRLLLALALLAGCRSTEIPWDSDPGPYDRLAATELAGLASARDEYDAGEHEAARLTLLELLEVRPRNLPVATLLQEVEFAWLLAGGAPPTFEPLPTELTGNDAVREAQARIAAEYLARARANPSAGALVLAARMERDPALALPLLDEALELDPACNWALYGRAYVHFTAGQLKDSRTALDAALVLDGGHLPARRLHTAMLARTGSTRVAIEALRTWLDVADGDPVLPRRRVEEARVDLAGLLVQDGEAEDALDVLETVERWRLQSPARAELVEAAAWHQLGRPGAALKASERAAAYAPEDLLPLLQHALLVQSKAVDVAERIAAWERLLEAVDREAPEGTPAAGLEEGLELLLVRLQANAWLERLRAEAGETPAP
jgi:Tfp pilus assembly protein PilF